MKAMILAAGRGRRLRPLTDRTPKALLEVGGKPLIVYHLEALARAGFREVVINLSWLGERIDACLGDGSGYGLDIVYSHEPEALETAGGIQQALALLGQRFVVINADIYTDFDFAKLRGITGDAHLVLVPNPPQKTRGDFSLAHNRVGNSGQLRYTFSGIAVYARPFFTPLAPGKQPLAPLLRTAAGAGRVTGEVFRGQWHDVGTPARLAALNRAR